MRYLLTVLLAAVICSGAGTFHTIRLRSDNSDPSITKVEAIRFTDISGDYLFVKNLSETERMVRSLQEYLRDDGIQIQTSVPEDATFYAEGVWDPAWAAGISGGPVYCVEAWDIFKNRAFQKTSYLAGRI